MKLLDQPEPCLGGLFGPGVGRGRTERGPEEGLQGAGVHKRVARAIRSHHEEVVGLEERWRRHHKGILSKAQDVEMVIGEGPAERW